MADTDTNTHGSRTEDEMVARLRDAGYADWEIAEEMDLKAWAEKTAAAHTRAFATEGRLKHIEPTRIDTQEKEQKMAKEDMSTKQLADLEEAAHSVAVTEVEIDELERMIAAAFYEAKGRGELESESWLGEAFERIDHLRDVFASASDGVEGIEQLIDGVNLAVELAQHEAEGRGELESGSRLAEVHQRIDALREKVAAAKSKEIESALSKDEEPTIAPFATHTKQGYTIIARNEDNEALLFRSLDPRDPTPYVIAYAYDEMTGDWADGGYYHSLLDATKVFDDNYINERFDGFGYDREKLTELLNDWGFADTARNINTLVGELDLAWSDETDLERVTYQVHDLVPDCIAELQEHLDVDPYAMLYRLQGVCKLAENGDVDRLITTNEFNNMLWGGSVEAHIEKMQTLYDSLPADERPDWCTQDMIDTYAEHLGVTPHVTPEVKAASQRPSLASKRQEATKASEHLAGATDRSEARENHGER